MKAVILAAGKSTRTFPLTVNKPKVMLKVLNKTLIEHNLEALNGLVDEIIVVVGFKQEMIREHLKDANLTFVVQEEQLGTGHALLLSKQHIDGKFIMLYGDDLISRKDILNLIKHKYAVLAKEVEHPERFGVLDVKDNKVLRIIEKPSERISNLANCGGFVLDQKVFDFKLEKTKRGEFEATDIINELAKTEDVYYETVNDYWIPIGYPWSLLEANSHFLKSIKKNIMGKIEDNVTIDGEVIIGEGTVVKSGTCIEGPVMIGRNCTIGPQGYIRPNTTIGDDCKVRAEVFDAIIGDSSTAKHYSYVAHSVLGDDVNIGAGTITADYRHDGKNHITLVKDQKIDSGRRKLGSFMGDHVRTAIGTLIYPGRKIWPWTSTKPGEIITHDKMDMDLRG